MNHTFRAAAAIVLAATGLSVAQAQDGPIIVQEAPPRGAAPGDAPSPPAEAAPNLAPPPAADSQAQQEEGPIPVAPPEPSLAGPSETPAAAPPAAAGATAKAGGEDGTTIVGDQETPIGLYITPWKNDYAEHGLDRPARFVDIDTTPIDPDVFHRRVEYYDVISNYRSKHLAGGK